MILKIQTPPRHILSIRLALLLALIVGGALRSAAQNTGDWQTVPGLASGYWDNDTDNSAGGSGTWQSWNGSAWVTQTGKVPGTSYPSNNITQITILSGTTISNSSSSSAIVADNLTVASGGSLQMQKVTFNLAHSGTATYDLDVFGTFGLACSSSANFSIGSGATVAVESGGTMTNFCNTSSDNFTGPGYSASAITFLNGSLFVMAGGKSGYIPLATWDTGSTVIYAPTAAGTFLPKQFAGQTFYNFIWNWPTQTGGTSGLSGNANVNGNFIIANANGTNVEDIPDGGFTLNVGGNIAVTNALWYPAASDSGNASVNVGGNFTIDSTAGIRVNKGADVCVVTFDGTSPQTLAIYGTNLSAGNFSWTVAPGSTVNLVSPLLINNGTGGGGVLTNNGTLNVTANGSITGSATIQDAPGAVFNVSPVTAGYSLAAGQTLNGGGSITGNVTVAGSATVHPTGGRTLTFANNLTINAAATNIFDLTASSSTGNDQVVLNGTGAALAGSGATITINSAGSLATSDYVLYKLTGASGTVTSAFNSTPAWAGTVPANASNYSIVTSGDEVLLHYSTGVTPQPVITTVSLSGKNLVLSGTNGAATTYYLVATTNLTLPLSQWIPVATNTLSTGGSFSITATNAVNPSAARQFYRLEIP